MRFEEKIVLITGGGSGIGAATARAFLEEGAKVAVADLAFPHLSAEAVPDENRLLMLPTDVREEMQVASTVQKVVQQWEKLDILVNNAGIEWVATIEETLPSDWDRVMDTNVRGMFLVARVTLPYLRKTRGVIVNTASQLSLVGSPYFVAYTTSKAAVLNFTRSLALELAKDGIRVNAVCPGAVDTPLLRRQFASGRGPQGTMEDLIAMHPLGRLGRPEEIARPILFLASEEASFMTGSAMVVDGGYVAQ